MKKLLIVTLVEGRVIKRDLSQEKGLPIGEPANSQLYAQICASIAAGGYTNPDVTDEKQYVHIAPSQIRTVKIVFE